jgi:2-polyprenyl-3-methyl-5-hydroxy-6-metoxy-1,4-benzoquinol methylase
MRTVSAAPISERDPEAKRDEQVSPIASHSLALCPVCGQAGAREWLRAPDRFHGRREQYRLARCQACSLVWLSNPPQPSDMRLHYTDAYHKLISAAGQNSPHRWRDRKAAFAPYKQSGALLDLGCSSGAFLESLKGDSWLLFGIEMSVEEAKTAEARSGASVFVGDIPEAPFGSESFDVITCFDVLEHVYDPRRVMAKVQEWLKPGGIFYVLVPNIDSAEARVFRSYWHGLELPRHLSHFSPASLGNLARSVGLRDVSLETRRNPAVGTSLRYLWDDAFSAIAIGRTPVAYRGEAGLPWRATRKLARMTVLRALLAMAPLAGGGESIHGIFRKQEIASKD